MKIVKADSKGRVTGLNPGAQYSSEENPETGQVILTEIDPYFENAEHVTDIKVSELFGLLDLDPMQFLADDGLMIRELPTQMQDTNIRFGIYLKRAKRKDGTWEVKNNEVAYDVVVVRLAN